MVTSATNLGRTGSFDFIFQRFSAIILAAYLFFIVGFLLKNPGLDYVTWKNLFDQTWMQIFSTMAIVSIIVHAYAGLWVVVTDYFTTRMLGSKGTVLRLLSQAAYTLILFVYLVWGLKVIWG